MLRRILVASAGAMALSGAALAAEPLPPPPPPPPIWTGLYIGGTIGGGEADLPVNNRDLFFLSGEVPLIDSGLDFKSGGFVGGVVLGYNWQVSQLLVLGVEGDFSGATFKANDPCGNDSCTFPVNGMGFLIGRGIIQSKLPWFATIRGRIGLAVDNVMVYATGGAAVARIDASWSEFMAVEFPVPVFPETAGPAAFLASDNSAHWGIAVGAGVEYMLTPNWIFRGEFLYMDFGTQSFNVTCLSFAMAGGCTAPPNFPSTFAGRFSSTATAAIARVGVEYKFNWGPVPVVAKY